MMAGFYAHCGHRDRDQTRAACRNSRWKSSRADFLRTTSDIVCRRRFRAMAYVDPVSGVTADELREITARENPPAGARSRPRLQNRPAAVRPEHHRRRYSCGEGQAYIRATTPAFTTRSADTSATMGTPIVRLAI